VCCVLKGVVCKLQMTFERMTCNVVTRRLPNTARLRRQVYVQRARLKLTTKNFKLSGNSCVLGWSVKCTLPSTPYREKKAAEYCPTSWTSPTRNSKQIRHLPQVALYLDPPATGSCKGTTLLCTATRFLIMIQILTSENTHAHKHISKCNFVSQFPFLLRGEGYSLASCVTYTLPQSRA